MASMAMLVHQRVIPTIVAYIVGNIVAHIMSWNSMSWIQKLDGEKLTMVSYGKKSPKFDWFHGFKIANFANVYQRLFQIH